MVPAGDMATQKDIDDSFSMANMIPQNKFCNEHPWKNIESEVRKYAKRSRNGVFVITGPVFEPRHNVIGPGKVWVPQYIYKLVYDQNKNKAWAYWIVNSNSAKITEPISYAELVKRTHINFIAGFIEKR
jgi:endonuclease G